MKRQLAILGIVALAFALRIHHLAHLSVWLDESFSILAAELPLPDLLQFVASRAHPPLYFVLLHDWLPLGSSEFVIRFLSLVWGLVGVVALYALGRRLFGEEVGLLAALLVAVSPIHVWHSQDARMYAQLFALATLSSYLLVQALSRNRAGYWLGYMVLAALSLYTHNTAFLTIAAQALFAVLYAALRRQWSLLWGWGAAMAGVALMYLPWLPFLTAQVSRLRQYFWIPQPTARTVLDTFDYMSSAMLFSDSPWHSDLDAWPGALLYLAFLGLFLLGSWRLIRHHALWSLLPFLLLIVPIAGEFELSFVRPMYLNRTLLVIAAPLFIIYAVGASAQRRGFRQTGTILLAITLGCNAVSLTNLHSKVPKEEWRQAANLVASRARPGDVIFFDQGLVQIPFDYYYHQQGPAVEEYGYPHEYTHWHTQRTMDKKQWWISDYVNADPEAAMARLTQIAQQHSTVWLVTNRPLSDGRLVTCLTEHSAQAQVYHFYRVTVHRFDMW